MNAVVLANVLLSTATKTLEGAKYSGYFGILIATLFAFIIIAGLIFVSVFLGPKRWTKVKLDPFECGNPPIDTPRKRISIHYFVIAMLFILFDIEMVYLFPWAIIFRKLGKLKFFGLIEMFVFIAILVLGLIYVWRKGALEWD